MKMADSRQIFEERVAEIEEFLDFVETTVPQLDGEGAAIEPIQQRILFSTVYLLLYNLIESTVAKSTEAVIDQIVDDARWTVADLSDEILLEWTRSNAKTHMEMEYERRLVDTAKVITEAFTGGHVRKFKITKGGGNWDDEEIYKFVTKRIGMALDVSTDVNSSVKRFVKGKMGIMKVVVNTRNDLAHGDLSFSEVGSGVTIEELRDYSNRIFNYLSELLDSFDKYVVDFGYIKPGARPEPRQGEPNDPIPTEN